MAIWCFSKTIACGTTVAAAALVYCIVALYNREEKKEMDKDDNDETFEINVTNTSSPNINNERQIFSKNSDQNNMPVLPKVKQVVSPLSKQRSNNPVKPSRDTKLYRIQSKAVEYCNSIMQNGVRAFTHNKSSEAIIQDNSDLSLKNGFGNQDNLNRSLIIDINNSMGSTNRVQIFNKSTFNINIYTSANSSTNKSLVIISQKNEPKEIDITIPLYNRRVVQHTMPLRGDRLTNADNNKYTKKIETNNVTIAINTSK